MSFKVILLGQSVGAHDLSFGVIFRLVYEPVSRVEAVEYQTDISEKKSESIITEGWNLKWREEEDVRAANDVPVETSRAL
jgi:hypothetical protein